MTDYYKLLGILPTATTDEIKKAYRSLALKYHPDRNPGDQPSEAFFKKVTEAYSILSDPEARENYNFNYKNSQQTSNNKNQQQTHTEHKQRHQVTPQSILLIFQEIRKKVNSVEKSRINKPTLYNALNDLLSIANINLLLAFNDTKTNIEIINEVFDCSKVLAYPNVENLSTKLVKLAGTDNVTIKRIYDFAQAQKKKQFRDKYGVLIILGAIFFILLAFALLKPKGPNTSYSYKKPERPKSGDLDSSFIQVKPTSTPYPTIINIPSPEEMLQLEKIKLIAEGWEEKIIENGQLPDCYNFAPEKSTIDNYLEVHVGGGTDVVIKVMNIQTNKCVRYVFINSHSTFNIRNIPEGRYYLKIAYGKEWLSKVENGQCIGKFIRNPIYEKGNNLMDFNLLYTSDSISIPSFQLKLDVTGDILNTFSSQNISESEFNK